MSLHIGIVRVGEKTPEKYFKALFCPDLKRVPPERESGASQFCRFALYCAYMGESCCSNVCLQFAAVVGFVLKCRMLQHRSHCVSFTPKQVLILYRRAYSKFHLLSFVLFPTLFFSYISFFFISSCCFSVPVHCYCSICDLSSTFLLIITVLSFLSLFSLVSYSTRGQRL
jgi:hypothetical protein